jgi:hypothetical protein
MLHNKSLPFSGNGIHPVAVCFQEFSKGAATNGSILMTRQIMHTINNAKN